MLAKGAPPDQIAAQQGHIYRTARSRLPYGTSIIDLPPGADDWEMEATVETGEPPRTLDRNAPMFKGVRVRYKTIATEAGSRLLRLTIDVDPST